MKSKIITVILVVSALSTSVGAVDFIGSLASQLTNVKNTGVGYICRKASVLDLKFSIRSGGGLACKTKYVAAVAELICTGPNTDDYAGSGCHKNAVVALGDKTPQDVLVEEALKLGGTAAQAICVAATTATGLVVLAPACSLIKKGTEALIK